MISLIIFYVANPTDLNILFRFVSSYQLTWQEFNYLFHLLFKPDVQYSISFIYDQTLQILVHKLRGILLGRKDGS